MRSQQPPVPRPDAQPGHGRRLFAWAAVVLAACTTLLLVLVECGWPPLADADRAVSARLHVLAVEHPGWTWVNRVLTDWVWDPVTMRGAAVITVVWLAAAGAGRLAVWAAVTTAAGLALQYTIRAATARTRPSYPDAVDSADNFALPSGHVTAATLTCGLLLTLLLLHRPPPHWRAVAWTTAVVSVTGVGLTRMWLGVHWPTDVLAGWLIGALVLTASTALLAPWRHIHPTAAPRTGSPAANAPPGGLP